MKVGLIGLKGHYGVMLEGLKLLEDVELVAVADNEDERLRNFPSADVRKYKNWRELLDRERLDAVVETDMDGRRAEVLVECARRRLPVLAEKPLAMNLEQLEAVRQAVQESGIRLSMLLTMRFESPYRVFRDLVLSGRVGKVCLASAQKSYKLGRRPAWQKDRRTFSGIIPFIGVHALDLIRWTTGEEFTEVMAYHGNTGHPEAGDMEDQAVLSLKLSGGGSADVRLDYCRPRGAPTHGDDRLRVAGSYGVVEAMSGRVVLITQEEGPRELLLPEPENAFVDFVESLRTGRPFGVPQEDAFRITEVVLKARASAETGRPVRL